MLRTESQVKEQLLVLECTVGMRTSLGTCSLIKTICVLLCPQVLSKLCTADSRFQWGLPGIHIPSHRGGPIKGL